MGEGEGGAWVSICFCELVSHEEAEVEPGSEESEEEPHVEVDSENEKERKADDYVDLRKVLEVYFHG